MSNSSRRRAVRRNRSPPVNTRAPSPSVLHPRGAPHSALKVAQREVMIKNVGTRSLRKEIKRTYKKTYLAQKNAEWATEQEPTPRRRLRSASVGSAPRIRRTSASPAPKAKFTERFPNISDSVYEVFRSRRKQELTLPEFTETFRAAHVASGYYEEVPGRKVLTSLAFIHATRRDGSLTFRMVVEKEDICPKGNGGRDCGSDCVQLHIVKDTDRCALFDSHEECRLGLACEYIHIPEDSLRDRALAIFRRSNRSEMAWTAFAEAHSSTYSDLQKTHEMFAKCIIGRLSDLFVIDFTTTPAVIRLNEQTPLLSLSPREVTTPSSVTTSPLSPSRNGMWFVFEKMDRSALKPKLYQTVIKSMQAHELTDVFIPGLNRIAFVEFRDKRSADKVLTESKGEMCYGRMTKLRRCDHLKCDPNDDEYLKHLVRRRSSHRNGLSMSSVSSTSSTKLNGNGVDEEKSSEKNKDHDHEHGRRGSFDDDEEKSPTSHTPILSPSPKSFNRPPYSRNGSNHSNGIHDDDAKEPETNEDEVEEDELADCDPDDVIHCVSLTGVNPTATAQLLRDWFVQNCRISADSIATISLVDTCDSRVEHVDAYFCLKSPKRQLLDSVRFRKPFVFNGKTVHVRPANTGFNPSSFVYNRRIFDAACPSPVPSDRHSPRPSDLSRFDTRCDSVIAKMSRRMEKMSETHVFMEYDVTSVHSFDEINELRTKIDEIRAGKDEVDQCEKALVRFVEQEKSDIESSKSQLAQNGETEACCQAQLREVKKEIGHLLNELAKLRHDEASICHKLFDLRTNNLLTRNRIGMKSERVRRSETLMNQSQQYPSSSHISKFVSELNETEHFLRHCANWKSWSAEDFISWACTIERGRFEKYRKEFRKLARMGKGTLVQKINIPVLQLLIDNDEDVSHIIGHIVQLRRKSTENGIPSSAEDGRRMCLVCMMSESDDNPIEVNRIVVPCGHQCLCAECCDLFWNGETSSGQLCPVCGQAFEQIIQRY